MTHYLSVLLFLPITAAVRSGRSHIFHALQSPGSEWENLGECSIYDDNSTVLETTANNSAHHNYSGPLPRQVQSTHHSTKEKDNLAAHSLKQNDSHASPEVRGVEQCGIYLAPSTIPGAGLGLFAGIDFEAGEEVTPGDSIVPIRDMHWHNSARDSSNYFLWDEYIWSGSTFNGMVEPFSDIDGASFGIGALPNCFFPFINVEDDNDSIRRDNAGVSRRSPSIGSFTPWHDRASHAVQRIPAGEEIFVDYGYGYFDSGRQHVFGLIPFLDDFPRADRILKNYLKVLKNMEKISAQTLSNDLYGLIKSVLDAFPSRTRLALPEDAKNIESLLENGGTAMRDYERSRRSVRELKEKGSCIDNLIVKPSTIPDAGRGAFTRRSIKKGSVVAPVPLIHLPDRAVLDMYAHGVTNPATGDAMHASNEPVHAQLLLNYCYGHSQSTLLLCPYGVVSSLVNHHPSMSNVEIIWSNKTTSKPEWLTRPLEEWAYTYQAGLGWDLVATRDIEEGEEILLHYGSDWQQAWDKHVAFWNAVELRIDQLNEAIDYVIPTENEWKWTMGDPNVDSEAVNLWCRDIYREMRGLPELSHGNPSAWPCKVLFRQDDPINGVPVYTAEIVQRLQVENRVDGQCVEIFDELLFDVPRDAFVFGGVYEHDDTRAYAQPWTFRHDLRIPEAIMPEAWKNLAEEYTVTHS